MTKGRLTRAAAIILTVAALFLLASCGFSYEKSKLKKYVKLAREDYYGVSVSIPAASVRVFAVEPGSNALETG